MRARRWRQVLRSEWTKIRSVHSTLWTLTSAVLVTVGLSALVCAFTRREYDDFSMARKLTFDPTFTSFAGTGLGQLAMIAFGVLVVSAEYSTGMIRNSLAAVPQRGLFLAGKVTVTAAVVLVVGMVTSWLSFLVGQWLLGPYRTDVMAPGVLRAVFGAGLYMALISLFAVGVTVMLRSPLLAFGVLMPFFFLISNVLNSVAATRRLARYLPDQAGATVMSVVPGGGDERSYGPWGGLSIMAAWVAAALLAGWVTLQRRDA